MEWSASAGGSDGALVEEEEEEGAIGTSDCEEAGAGTPLSFKHHTRSRHLH